jgi:hypothetical protein
VTVLSSTDCPFWERARSQHIVTASPDYVA